MESFSVLMSLYIKEQTSNFVECLESILNQTLVPDEIVIVIDGPISSELRTCVEKYKLDSKVIIKTIYLEKNIGLGPALAIGINHCSHKLVARMDTDDICRLDRFEIQVKCFKENKNLDICGSHIIEFEENIENEISRRVVPLSGEKIIQYQKYRSAFNHMSVMYKKDTVLKAGNYENAPLMEDDLLWSRMIKNNAVMMNIDDYLVYVRAGTEMIKRRGGISYLVKYYKARKKIKEIGFIGNFELYLSVLIQIIFSLVPTRFRRILFIGLLR